MIKIYTGLTSYEVKDIVADVYFPEFGLSPDEQIDWVRNNYSQDISILTFSPYILEMFNVIIAENDWTDKDINVLYMYEGQEQTILATTEDGKFVIDTFDITTEPMSHIFSMYKQALNNKQNED